MTAGGPSSLGTLLIQRLDSLLGLTQSQQLNLSAGARPDAVTPTEKSHPGQPLRNPGKKPLATAQQRATQARATGHSPLERSLTSTPNAQPPQSSIQTHFGRTAHFILQLFEQLPQAPGLHSPQPLLSRPLSSPAPPSAAHPTPHPAPCLWPLTCSHSYNKNCCIAGSFMNRYCGSMCKENYPLRKYCNNNLKTYSYKLLMRLSPLLPPPHFILLSANN